jgi:hypothetical protein
VSNTTTLSPDERMLQIRKRVKEIDAAIAEANSKDWTAYASDVMDKFFGASVKVKEFLDNCIKQAVKHNHVMSPAGRVRNLWRVITGKPGVIAAASRRAQNSPIQGFSSELGCVSAYNILRSSYFFLKRYGRMSTGFPMYCRAVHDANYYCVPYEFVIPFIHIFQYESTQGSTDWYRKVMKVPFTIEPELEMDIGAHDADTHTWSWDLNQLADAFVGSLKTQLEIGRLKPEDFNASLDSIIEPWVNKETRAILFEEFPLQNVREDMNHLVDAFLNRVDILRKEVKL